MTLHATDIDDGWDPNERPPWEEEEQQQDERSQQRDLLRLELAGKNRAVSGGSFILDAPAGVPALWGNEDEVLWAAGEPLMICGPSGVGKTTTAQQLLLHALGRPGGLLGYPVGPVEGCGLYLAMDRPRQVQRSFARMVEPGDRGWLDQRLTVWKGPLPFAVHADPVKLAVFAEIHGAGVLVIDSLKDLVGKLNDDERAGLTNQAIQHCIACGIEVIVLHHQRKGERSTKPTTIADVYGNQQLTAGMGSVVLLWGEPGDLLVELTHLKQPASQVGPLEIRHDHDAGQSHLERGFDLLAFIGHRPAGATATEIACARYGTTSPTKKQIAVARRQAQAQVGKTLAAVEPEGSRADRTTGEATKYHLLTLDEPSEEPF